MLTLGFLRVGEPGDMARARRARGAVVVCPHGEECVHAAVLEDAVLEDLRARGGGGRGRLSHRRRDGHRSGARGRRRVHGLDERRRPGGTPGRPPRIPSQPVHVTFTATIDPSSPALTSGWLQPHPEAITVAGGGAGLRLAGGVKTFATERPPVGGASTWSTTETLACAAPPRPSATSAAAPRSTTSTPIRGRRRRPPRRP